MSQIYKILLVFCVLLVSMDVDAGEPGEMKSIPLEDQPQELVRHIVWTQARPFVPHFIPAQILRVEGVDGLTLDPDVQKSLVDHLAHERQRAEANKPHICDWTSEDGFASQGNPQGRSMVEVLKKQDIVALGKVQAVVPGWAVHLPDSMVYVEIDQLLHCRQGYGEGYAVRDVAPGEIVATTLKVGSFELEGLTLCRRTPEGFNMPQIGDLVVVGGSPRPEDPHFIGHWGPVFVVEGEDVLPQPYENFRWDRVPLQDLVETFKGPFAGCAAEH